MAVVSCKPKTGVPRGRARSEGVGEEARRIFGYEAEFIVQVDDLEDGPGVVIDFFNGSEDWPKLGTPYSFGNDPVDYSVRCSLIDPQRTTEDPYTYIAKVAWTDLQSQTQKPDENGNETNNPLLWRDEIEIDWMQRMVPATDAIYREGFKVGGKSAEKYPAGKVGLPVNSALEPFDPPFEKEDAFRVVRWTKYMGEYVGSTYENLKNAVNDADFVINKPKLKYYDKWNKYAARLASISAALSYENQITHWKMVFVFLIDNELTWRPRILDRGMNYRADVGDPNGLGGLVTQAQIDAGQLPYRAILDKNGQALATPVRLNGDSVVLKPSEESVYLTYSIYPREIAYSSLNL